MSGSTLPLHLSNLLTEVTEVTIVPDNARIPATSVTEEAYRIGSRTQRRRKLRGGLRLFSDQRSKPTDRFALDSQLSLMRIAENTAPLVPPDDRIQRARLLRDSRWRSEPMSPPGVAQQNVILKARSPPKADVPVAVPVRRPSSSHSGIDAARTIGEVMNDLNLLVEEEFLSKDTDESGRDDSDLLVRDAVLDARRALSMDERLRPANALTSSRSLRIQQAFEDLKVNGKLQDEDETSTTYDMSSLEFLSGDITNY